MAVKGEKSARTTHSSFPVGENKKNGKEKKKRVKLNMFHNARRLHSGTNCCCTQKSEGGKRKNSHTIRLEKHHVPNRTLLLLLRPDGVYNITPGFSVKLNFVFPFSRMGNWSIRLLSFVWVLIRVIIISRTDHAGMRGGGGCLTFQNKKRSARKFYNTRGE